MSAPASATGVIDFSLVSRRLSNSYVVGIVGPALRGTGDPERVTPESWAALVDKVEKCVHTILQLRDVAPEKRVLPAVFNPRNKPMVLTSGGAPFGDHVAVALALKNPSLTCYLFTPCPFDVEAGCFAGDSYEAKRLNQLHTVFSERAGIQSLHMIRDAIRAGRLFVSSSSAVSRGFSRRNRLIGTYSSTLIAIAWEHEDFTAGTQQTVDAFSRGKKSLQLRRIDA